jgi:hypothetical protein
MFHEVKVTSSNPPLSSLVWICQKKKKKKKKKKEEEEEESGILPLKIEYIFTNLPLFIL